MNVAQDIADFKQHFVNVVNDGETFLREHIPRLTEVAQRIEADPLMQAVMTAALPDSVRAMLAEMVTKLAAEFPCRLPELLRRIPPSCRRRSRSRAASDPVPGLTTRR